MWANTRRPSGTVATPCSQTAWAGSAVTSTPPTTIPPRRARWMPAIALTSVVLPAPLGPTMLTDLAGADVELDAPQRLRVAVEGIEVTHLKHRRCFPR